MSVKERLTQYIKFKEITAMAFCKSINVSNAFVSSMRKSLQPDKLESIALKYPDLNTGWLMTGEGEMLKSGDASNLPSINYEHKGVPYYDVDFIAGFDLVVNDQTVNPDYYIDFKQYNNAGQWVNITGHSMEPLMSHGDIMAIKEIADWETYILYGEVYAIVTSEYRTVKKIRKGATDESVRLVPINPDFDEQEIPKSIIKAVYQVHGCTKRIF